MFPPLGATLNASAAVKAIFGTNPLRIYPFGEAPAKGTQFYAVPYAVFQLATGVAENYLADLPDADNFTVQIDVYGDTATESRNGAKAIRDAVEPVAYVGGYRGDGRDADTGLYRYTFDVDWMTLR